jgi:GDPmannose 4,6-dehydratase
MSKIALITGANGQLASYMAEYLIELGYIVHGTIRRNSVPESQTTRIEDLHTNGLIKLHYADLTDPNSIQSIIADLQPELIFHYAAQSHVQISYELPQYTLDVNGSGTLSILEAVRKFSPNSKIYNSSTSEMFGNNFDADGFQRETTIMSPVSPYGCSKLYAHTLCKNYRNAYGIKVYSGIMFNTESPRRGINFVTNKVVYEAVKIKKGLSTKLVLGNIKARRDWSHAKDCVKAHYALVQLDTPDDYVIASGQSRSVEDLVSYVFNKLDMDYTKFVSSDKKYERPEELHYLQGDSSKFRSLTGWAPEISFEEMIDEMIEYWLSKI